MGQAALYIGVIWGWLYWDNGKENGNYRDYRDYMRFILELFSNNGKENGNYRDYTGFIGVGGLLKYSAAGFGL